MGARRLKGIIEAIVIEAMRLRDLYTEENLALVNYVAIFSRSDEEYDNFIVWAESLGNKIKEATSGPLFQLKPPLLTAGGKLQLLKIKKPDSARPERGAADFTPADYIRFKESYLSKDNFNLIYKQNIEMLELTDPKFNVRVCFPHPPLIKLLNI